MIYILHYATGNATKNQFFDEDDLSLFTGDENIKKM